ARNVLSQRERDAVDQEQLKAARREVLIAEGSDWFWWFGRSHDSGMDQIWDSLFRLYLRNIYILFRGQPPARLSQPIITAAEGAATKRPDRKITPKLNGMVDQEEWNAGGYVDVTALFGAMHPPKGAVRRIWFGHDDRNLYLRFDLLSGPVRPVELEVRFSGRGGPVSRLSAPPSGSDVALELRDGNPGTGQPPRWTGRVTAGEPLAFAVPFDALGHQPGETLEMVAVAFDAGKPVEQLPPTGPTAGRVPGGVVGERQSQPLKILLVSAEVAPFAQDGGLAGSG